MVVQKKLYTLDEYHQFLDEHHEGIYELIDGEIIQKMPSFLPSAIAARLIFFLMQYLTHHPIGYVTGAKGSYQMPGEGNEYIPDVAYISKERLPQLPERHALLPPDLAVEIKSPTDFVRDLRYKAVRYLGFGTRLVWLVLPDDQTVEVYTPDQDVQTLAIGDTLSGGDMLPGFTLPVQQIFDL